MEKKNYYWLSLLLLLTISFSACTASREQEVEDELADFRTWVNDQSANIADRTEEDWEQAKLDFQTRTAELDLKEDEFSEEVRQEYNQLKADFQDLDEEREKRMREANMAEWNSKLLGSYADMSTITSQNIREVYIQFLENVRNMRSTWTDEDWEMAKMVMTSLNEKKEAVDDDLSTEDEVKIKALQMEFHTLETSGDVVD